MDFTDIIMKLAIFATFVLFALALLGIKLSKVKGKKESQTDGQNKNLKRFLRIAGIGCGAATIFCVIWIGYFVYLLHQKASHHGERKKSRGKDERKDVKFIGAAVNDYHLDTGELPESLNDLLSDNNLKKWDGPYLRARRDLIDSWGNPYKYEILDKNNLLFDVYSLGADNKAGGTEENTDIHYRKP